MRYETIVVKNQAELDKATKEILAEYPEAVAYNFDGFQEDIEDMDIYDLYPDRYGFMIWKNEEESKNDTGINAVYRITAKQFLKLFSNLF